MREQNNQIVFKMLFDKDESVTNRTSSQLLYSAEDIKQAEVVSYNQGFEQGHTAGLKQGEEKVVTDNQKQMQSLIETLAQKTAQLIDQDTLNMKQSTEKIILLTKTIIKKILPNLINKHGVSEIEAIIRHIFSTFLEKQTLLIHLNPEILPIISHDLEDITVKFGKLLNFEQDAKLGLYDCEIEWQGGGALWSQTCTLQKIEEVLMTSLNTISTIEEPIENQKNVNPEEVHAEINEKALVEIKEETNEEPNE